ncbi:MAG: MFS transporter, partial [Clostridia bacterium]
LGVPRQGQRHSPQLKQRDASFMLEIKEGLRFVRSIPFLLYGMICFSLVMLGIQLVDSQIMILLRELKHVSTSFIGVTMGASGIGLLCIAVLLGKRRLTTPFQLMAAGAVGMGVAYACVGLSVSNEGVAWWLIPVLFLGGGASVGMVFIPFQTQAQRSTPVELSGRVFGTVNSVVTAAVIIGPILGAVLVTGFGVITAFVIAGCSLILMGAAAFLLRNRVERSERIVAKSDGAAQGTTQA